MSHKANDIMVDNLRDFAEQLGVSPRQLLKKVEEPISFDEARFQPRDEYEDYKTQAVAEINSH